MAMTNSSATFAAADSQSFTYTKPAGNYGFVLGPQLDVPVALSITDNGDGTGTLNLSGPATGTVQIWTVDKP